MFLISRPLIVYIWNTTQNMSLIHDINHQNGLSIIRWPTSGWLRRLWRAGFWRESVVEPAVSCVTTRWQEGHFCCSQDRKCELHESAKLSLCCLLLYIRWSMKIHLQQEWVFTEAVQCVNSHENTIAGVICLLWMCSVCWTLLFNWIK